MSDGKHVRAEELELYALGGLPEEDAAALKAHVAGCGECAMKLAQAQGSAALLAFAARQERPAGTIKAELMARIHADHETGERFAWPLTAEAPGRIEAPRRTGTGSGPRSRGWNWVLASAAVALVALSVILWLQNRKLAAEVRRERQSAELLVQEQREIQKLVRILAAPDTLTVKLTGTESAAGASGVVKYNGRMGILVYSAELPALPADKNYQLWLMPVDGAPISAGQLRPGDLAVENLWTSQVRVNTTPKEFVVTVEPSHGTSQPSGRRVLIGAN